MAFRAEDQEETKRIHRNRLTSPGPPCHRASHVATAAGTARGAPCFLASPVPPVYECRNPHQSLVTKTYSVLGAGADRTKLPQQPLRQVLQRRRQYQYLL
jgi:hypothetical protein